MIEIWFVEDFMSGEVLTHRYLSTEVEAVESRNHLGYGIVLRYQFADGGVMPKHDKCPLDSVGGPCE